MKSKKQIHRRQFIKNTAISTAALSAPMLLSNEAFGTDLQSIKNSAEKDFHKTSRDLKYKCLFNHELLIVTDKKDNNREYIQSFIKKLEDTDVDAIMCCPLSWRTNLFPSEVDQSWKKYKPGQPLSKFPLYDYIMMYLHSGGDPVKDTLEACRRYKKDFLISYRMNDHHHLNDLSWPTHNDFWREHPEYWQDNSDGNRYFNYMLPEVRDHYFSILRELCTNYDVDGVELDFQRSPRFFRPEDMGKGKEVMDGFVRRIKKMMEKIGEERGKYLKLSIRVPHTVDKCLQIGLDVLKWDSEGLIDIINISSYFIHTIEIGIEEFKTQTKHAGIYGEMHFITDAFNSPMGISHRRLTTLEMYYATAFNFLYRGVDGISLFNFDYIVDSNWQKNIFENIPAEKRITLAKGLKGITDIEFLKNVSKDYIITSRFGSLRNKNEDTIRLVIPDDTGKVRFDKAILRVELKEPAGNAWSSNDLHIGVWLNGARLEPCGHQGTELFKPIAMNGSYPLRESLKFYTVPLNKIISGENEVVIKNMDKDMLSCEYRSLEIALYK